MSTLADKDNDVLSLEPSVMKRRKITTCVTQTSEGTDQSPVIVFFYCRTGSAFNDPNLRFVASLPLLFQLIKTPKDGRAFDVFFYCFNLNVFLSDF